MPRFLQIRCSFLLKCFSFPVAQIVLVLCLKKPGVRQKKSLFFTGSVLCMLSGFFLPESRTRTRMTAAFDFDRSKGRCSMFKGAWLFG
ncbi:MAG: hypothetical protein D3910_15930 [Candidatus Electrothrix sp. ATG2]|nr:hypothetical protein [Candidatus Electrothrix sp. ATG2]